jgi:hypothetical protein
MNNVQDCGSYMKLYFPVDWPTERAHTRATAWTHTRTYVCVFRMQHTLNWHITFVFITIKLLDFVHRPDFYKQKTQRFGNWICFRLQARGGGGETPTLKKNKSLPFHRRCQNKRRKKGRRKNICVKHGWTQWEWIIEDGILHSHRRENLKSYIALTVWAL